MVLFFPDNTVLINFAVTRQMTLLERLANGSGRWVAAVAAECEKSSWTAGLEYLRSARAIFGDPFVPDVVERIYARTLRDALARPGELSAAHLGEAETTAIITRRGMQDAAVFVTDDHDASVLARKHRIRIADTWDLLELAVKVEMLSEGGRRTMEQGLHDAGRRRRRQA